MNHSVIHPKSIRTDQHGSIWTLIGRCFLLMITLALLMAATGCFHERHERDRHEDRRDDRHDERHEEHHEEHR